MTGVIGEYRMMDPVGNRHDIREALRQVVDPERGVNIVDLGLVHRIELDGGRLRVEMTLTSADCPLRELSLILRIVGDLVDVMGRWRVWGGLLNAAPVLLFLINTISSINFASRRTIRRESI
jgi:hypothetical protein